MIGLFDGGCFAGHDLETGFWYPVENLLADFDRYGVARGLVGSYRCLYQDVREGNREAAEWAARFPDRLIPLAILHPVYYGESPEKLLCWLKRDLGFQVVGLFSSPAYHAVEWDSPAVRRVGEVAAELGIVLQAGICTEAELAGVMRAWGELRMPVMIRWMAGHRYKTLASEMVVAARCPDFRFDVGNMSSNGMLERAVECMGAERLFLASNTPHNIPACPYAAFRDAQLTAAQRSLIGGETIRRAFGLGTGDLPSSSFPFRDEADWEGLRTCPKVDIHWHPDHWNLGEPCLSEAEQIDTFGRYGYERVIMFSILALNYDLKAGNAQTAAWFGRDARVFGLIVVNPLQQSASFEQIERYADHPRFVGIKTIQDVFGLGLDDALYEPILERAAEKGLPVLAHMPSLDIAAQRHPEITFVAAHANWGRAQRFIDLPNVCFDFSTGHALRHETQLGRFIQAVGVRRLLFGSDGQVVSPQWSLAKLYAADLQAVDYSFILRENAYRVFPKLRRPEDRCLKHEPS